MKFISCAGYKVGNPIDGYDYECEYEKSSEFGCEECICTGGDRSPISGRVLKQSTVAKYRDKY